MDNNKKYKHLFGPIQSRRLGVSLGIDLIPFKTCPLDCVYCECGKTTDLTCTRKVYIPTAEVCAELKDLLTSNPKIDFLTFSGAGEPTLAKNIGEVIGFLKKNFSKYPICVLTNGVLFTDSEVRQEIKQADLVVPSLDAVSEECFQKINRPERSLINAQIIPSLITFAKEYTGKIWLEFFVIPGINDTKEELELFKSAALQMKPEKVQINSLDRHGTESWVPIATKEQLEAVAKALAPLPVDIVSRNYPAKPQLRQASRRRANEAQQ